MEVLILTYDELNELHQLTELSFFEDQDGNVNTKSLQLNADLKYIYGVAKFKEKFPNIDISGFETGVYKFIENIL